MADVSAFDVVTGEWHCPQCGEKLDNWQTTDSPWVSCSLVDYKVVSEFHNACEKCGLWISYRRKAAKGPDDFTMSSVPLISREAGMD